MSLAYRLAFILPPTLALVPAGRHQPCIAGCVLEIEPAEPGPGALAVITGPSRERVFEQAARFLKIVGKNHGPQVIPGAVLTSPCGHRDGWSILVNAEVGFAPTALGAELFPRSGPVAQAPA